MQITHTQERLRGVKRGRRASRRGFSRGAEPGRGAGQAATVVRGSLRSERMTSGLERHSQQRAGESAVCALSLSQFLDAARRVHSRWFWCEGTGEGVWTALRITRRA